MEKPSIACLMVSRRPKLAIRAVKGFCAQEYPEKSLVVVSDGEDNQVLTTFVRRLRRTDISVISRPQGALSLGALRNLAVDMADGEYVVQWDDDDLYHPQRLAVQIDAVLLGKTDACFLVDQLNYLERTRSLYWCDWSRPRGVGAWAPAAPNTLLCRKSNMPRYPEQGSLAHRSEDMYVMEQLIRRRPTTLLRGMGWCYVYVHHGGNTWDEAHHLHIIGRCGLSAEDLISYRPVLNTALYRYRFRAPLIVRDYVGKPVVSLSKDGQLMPFEAADIPDG